MATNKFSFTRKLLADLKPADKRQAYSDADTRGLVIDVTPNNVKTFRVYRKVAGRPERITLGRFNAQLPESREFPQGFDLLKALLSQPELNVRMARRLAEAVNVHLDSGMNPAETKRKARGELTLGELMTKWEDEYAKPRRKRSLEMDRSTFDRYLGELTMAPPKKGGRRIPKPACGVNWSARKLSAIRHEEVRRLQLAIANEASIFIANRAIELLRRLYNKAIAWGDFSGTPPTRGIEFFNEKARDRFLQASEMPAFWKALAEDPSEEFRDIVAIALLVGSRSGNVMGMAWKDIDFAACEWRISDEESKNGDVMRAILVPEAIQILKRRQSQVGLSPWVFPSDSACGHVTTIRKRWTAMLKRAQIENLRIHDLRRSLGSWQARTGASMLIIGKSLGHKSQEATEIYARLDTDPVREAVNRATSAMLAAARGTTAEVVQLPVPPKKAA